MKEYESIEEMVLAAKKKALSLLQVQDRTEAQLRTKLLENGFPESVVEIAMEYVQSFHYIDDERYARNYVDSRQGAKSKQQIRMELLKKGVSDELIREALALEYETEESNLIEELLAKKKYRPDMDYKEKNRIISYVMRRGFQLEDIRRCMNLYEEE